MSPTVRPRGPLPARIYWTRRLLVLGVPLLLVVVLARVLGGSADGTDGEQATQAAARSEAVVQPAPVQGPTIATPTPPGKNGKPAPPPEPVLAEPSGPCADSDVVATPTVTTVPGGADVPITFALRTRESQACTWQVSPETFTVTITSGKDHIWSTRECPASVPVQDVVVRQAVDAPIAVTWHARRSDETCSRFTDWARPGYYHVMAAALGGEASEVQFQLVPPSAPVVTKTVEPEKGKAKGKGRTKTEPGRSHKPGQDGSGNPEG